MSASTISGAPEAIYTSATCFLCKRNSTDTTISDKVPVVSPEYLHSSFSPTPLQSKQCSDDLKLVHAAVRECEKETAALRDVLTLYQTKMNDLRARVSQYRSVLSPIRRLPKELLVEIFSHCTPHPYVGRFGSCGVLNTPFSIPIIHMSRVCSWWRRLILSTGTLWASFECTLNEAMSTGGIGLKCLDVHLERSGDALLSFQIKGDLILPGHSLVRRLLDEKRRWMHVSFNCRDFSLPGWELAPGGLPNLKEIWIDSTVVVDAEPEGDILPLVEIAAPSLRYLDLSPALTRQVIFPFERITHLILNHYSSSAELFKTLSSACASLNLEYLELYQGRGGDDDDDFDYAEFHAGVRHRKVLTAKALLLIVSDDALGVILTLLTHCFTLPLLHTFKVGRREPIDAATTSHIVGRSVAFLETVTHLKSLAVHGIPVDDSQILRIINRTPQLEELSLTFEPGHGPLLLKELTIISTQTMARPALPALRGVNFFFNYSSQEVTDALTGMLTSRLESESSDTAEIDNIIIECEDARCTREVAMQIRTTASANFQFRWMGDKSFSLLKTGHRHRWTDVAELHYITLFNLSTFEIHL